MKIPEPYRKLYRLALDQGWSVSLTRNSHLAWTNPEGQTVFSPSSPSDQRGVVRVKAKLRRNGLVV